MDTTRQNELADALTNADYSAFNPALEIKVDPKKLDFLVMGSMIEVAEDLYARVKQKKAEKHQGKMAKQRKQGREEKFKTREPW